MGAAPSTWNAPVASAGTTDTSHSDTGHTDLGKRVAWRARALEGGLAERYATALYALAEQGNEIDLTVQQMDRLGRLIDASADLRRLLDSPLIDVQTSHRAVRAVLQSEGFPALVQNFAGVVVENRRQRDLRNFIHAFAVLVSHRRGVVVAHVTTAHPLSDVQVQQLRARLIECGYGNVDIHAHVDPHILGGLIVRIGARLYDASLRSRLQRLRYAMKGAA
jgi:F-type H+-transporting ATPase subunit delta